ncbi:MAG: hypothetical protein ACRD88_18140, partial [Terriglobia bacterium]
MNGESESRKPAGLREFFASPWKVAGVLFAIFLVVQGYLALRDREVTGAIDEQGPFAVPALPLQFSRKMAYDPLSFLGRGRQAGLWNWTPDGLVLTEEGKKFFEQAGEQFLSRAPAGRRRVTRVSDIAASDGRREIWFFYEWTEIAPPAAALLYPPPRPGAEYLGRAVLEQAEGAWRVTSLETRDFDESLARLQDIAAGVR